MEPNHYILNALKANYLFELNSNYIVEEGEVLIVDEFTGRVLKGRRYSDGLHQAIEAKEGVNINEDNLTVATITYQNYFRLYNKLSGMTGTAKTEETEFNKIYDLDVVTIPTNKPDIRINYPDVIYKNEKEVAIELLNKYESQAIKYLSKCGVAFVTTMHGDCLNDIKTGIVKEILNKENIPSLHFDYNGVRSIIERLDKNSNLSSLF